MATLSYVLSITGLISIITASLIKGEKMKSILFLVFASNALVGTGYLLEGRGINGAAALYLGAVETLINYFFDSKNKQLPKWLIGIYAVATVVVALWVADLTTSYAIFLAVLVIIASLSFIMCIIQNTGAKYRFWTIVNMVLWCTYDICAWAWTGFITHITLLLFTVFSMIIHDRKAKE